MTVRAVEGKKPYTGGKAIEITEDKVINLRLRSENNLIIYDEGDDEIYVDLQLPDGIEPLDTFPVGITTGRVLVDDDWDVNGTIVCFKTTSGDNIKLLYGDDGKLYIDNGTGLFKQIYLKGEVDALLQALRDYVDAQLALKQDKLIAGENIVIAPDGKTISAVLPPLSRFLSLWDCETGLPISFPTSDLPFEYITGDHYLVENVGTTNYRPTGTEFDGTASLTVETEEVQVGDLYIYDGSVWLLQLNHERQTTFSNIAGDPYDNTNLGNALNSKQNTLTAGQNITIDQNNKISVDYSWETITLSSGSATLTDTRCKLIPTGNFTLQAPSTVSEGQEYILRCENTTVYTMTLGTGFTNPHNVDLTLSANATDQFVFLVTPSGDLELQPAQLGEGTGISISNGNINNTLPGAIVSSTAPSNPSQGTLWYDTTNNKLKSYDGTNWNVVGGATYSAGDGISINNNTITNTLPGVIVSSTAPSSPTQGTYWYYTIDDTLFYYDGSSWNHADNVKTFQLLSLSDNTTLQTISNWIIYGIVQNCIAVINYNMGEYYLNTWISTMERIGTTTYMIYHFYFRSIQNFATTSGGTTTIYQKQLDISYRTPGDTYACTATDETITTITEGITNDTTGTTTTVSKLWAGTAAELALITKDANTLYISF